MEFLASDSENDEEKELQRLTEVIRADDALLSESSHGFSQPTSLGVPSTSSSNARDQISKIETAIALNKLMSEKFARLETMLKNRLSECEKRLEQFKVDKGHQKLQTEPQFRYIHCGKPYFRDAQNVSAPDNEDTILMSKSGMYDLSMVSSVPGWTVTDKSQLVEVMLQMSRAYKAQELKSKIAQLKRDTKVAKPEDVGELKELEEEIDAVKKKSLEEVAMKIEEEYDWELIATKLNRRHSAQEYQSFWKLFLHPSINKCPWTKEEHIDLQRLAAENNYQDWDKIAKDLNTGRTGYQCFVYFRTNTNTTYTGQKWTQEEVEYLKRLIEFYREKDYIPWNKIAAGMENRTKTQIYNKYTSLIAKKGRYLPEEDSVILACVKKYGKNFAKISEHLPGRSPKQIQVRYNIIEKTPTVSVMWTPDEDRRLVQLIANTDTVVNYASITPFFPGKNRCNIRSRYITLKNWLKRHPHEDVGKAPRRMARRLAHGQADLDLKKALDKLKARMETEVNIKRRRKITVNSSEKEIEDSIITTLVNEVNFEKQSCKAKVKVVQDKPVKIVENPEEMRTSWNENNLHRILILLRAKLNKGKFLNIVEDKNVYRYKEKYPGLLSAKLPNRITRWYSKKAVVEPTNGPDIWGANPLGYTQYYLPPNYNTITGCRSLLRQVTPSMRSPETAKLSIFQLEKNNVLIRDQRRLMMERFSTLFLWPMMLSTRPPVVREPTPIASTSNAQPGPVKPNSMNHTYIPNHWVNPQFREKDDVNNHIDLADLVQDPKFTAFNLGVDFMSLLTDNSAIEDLEDSNQE